MTEEQKIARDFFVMRRREQRIRARQVDELVANLVELEPAFGAAHRLARPVAGVLFEAGQRVEQRRLARIRISGERDDAIEALELHAHALELSERHAAFAV